MSSSEKRKADESDASGEQDSSAAKKPRATAMTNASESITDIVSHLHNLLQTKEEDLKKREAEFERRVKTFESSHPSIGGDNDVIQLNVGGRTNIAVFRNTLTQFPDSMLAAKFSGRWDDSMEKDRDGNYFVDADPDNFGILLKFLRMRMTNGHVPVHHIPEATFEFCSMLEYYNLMPGVYRQDWIGKHDTFKSYEVGYGTVSLTSKESVTAAVILQPKLNLLEFTVEFDKGTTGSVGWVSSSYTPTNVSGLNCSKSLENSLFLNVGERKAFGPRTSSTRGGRHEYNDKILAENLRINHTESTTKVTCRRFGGDKKDEKKFSIGLEDGTTVEETMSDYGRKPMIVFTGKVIVSGLKYAIDELTE